MSHQISNDHVRFQLTPIEQNGIKQYKRIAVVLPTLLSRIPLDGEVQAVENGILTAFVKTLEAWPLLRCSVGTSKDEKLILLGKPPEYDDAQSEPRGPPSTKDEMLSQLCSDSLGAEFFRSERGLNLATGMPPVMIKVVFVEGFVVVGFSFYEAVVDGEFISRFFYLMTYFTWLPIDPFQHWHRTPLEAFPAAAIDRSLFSFYNWSNSPLPDLTPNNRLVCRLIEFRKPFVTDLIVRMRQATGNSTHGHKDEYYVVAMLWVAIIHARLLKRRIGHESTARLNILLPGEPNTRRGERIDWRYMYFGSSTVPTVAELSVPLLSAKAHAGDNNYPNGFQGEISPIYRVRGLAEAAKAIHSAINKVDDDYVQQLMGLKNGLRPDADREAYSRGIDRHTTGMVFEDWSGYFRDEPIGTSYTTGQVTKVLPCVDDKEEGKIVLLPPMQGLDDKGNEIGCAAWVCLDVDDMAVVLRNLASQGWIIGEAAASVNTTGSS